VTLTILRKRSVLGVVSCVYIYIYIYIHIHTYIYIPYNNEISTPFLIMKHTEKTHRRRQRLRYAYHPSQARSYGRDKLYKHPHMYMPYTNQVHHFSRQPAVSCIYTYIHICALRRVFTRTYLTLPLCVCPRVPSLFGRSRIARRRVRSARTLHWIKHGFSNGFTLTTLAAASSNATTHSSS